MSKSERGAERERRRVAPAASRMGLLDVFKDGELVETIELSASKRVYKVGRQAGLADIVLSHGSISREQATLTVSASGSVVVADQGSAHGTFLSGKRLPANKPHLLAPGRSLTFGSSSRIFKLREGTGGFVADVGSAPQDTLNLSAARLLEDPKVQAVLHVLRNGAPDVERPRPDGFVPLHAVLNAASVVRVGCSETELASLPAKLSSVVEASTHDGKLLLRAVDGHADAMRVDTSLHLVPIPPDSPVLSGEPSAAGPQMPNALPAFLVHCATFRTWNAVRSLGAGAGITPARPIRLCLAAPPEAAKLGSLGRKADLHVCIRTASLLDAGIALFRVVQGPADGDGDGGGGDGAAATAGALDQYETIVCVGDGEGGAIGPWHYDRVESARDSSEMMGGAEIEPLREARAKQQALAVEKKLRSAEAEEARRKQREASRARRENAEAEAIAEASRPAEKFNPYLAHMVSQEEEEDE